MNSDPSGLLYLPVHIGHNGWTEISFYFSDYSTFLIAEASASSVATLRNYITTVINKYVPWPLNQLLVGLVDKGIVGAVLEAKRIAGYTQAAREQYLRNEHKKPCLLGEGWITTHKVWFVPIPIPHWDWTQYYDPQSYCQG